MRSKLAVVLAALIVGASGMAPASALAKTCDVQASQVINEGYYCLSLTGRTENLKRISCKTLNTIVRGAFREFVGNGDLTDTARTVNGHRYYVTLKRPFFAAFLRSKRIPQVMDVADARFDDICRIRWTGKQTDT